MKTSLDRKLRRERDFHNWRFASPSIRANQVKRFYQLSRRIREKYKLFLIQNCEKARVLEYGCSIGNHSLELARNGAKVVGIDISDVALRTALDNHKQEGLNPKANFLLMNGENLGFAEDCFDLVCGQGILHHLQLEKAMIEITRVLHPQGKAIFVEPLGNNFFINMYRRLTPGIRSEDEHPLLREDFEIIKSYFRKVHVQHFYFAALTAVPFVGLPGGDALISILEGIDYLLFKSQFIQKQAWQVLIRLSEPIKHCYVSR